MSGRQPDLSSSGSRVLGSYLHPPSSRKLKIMAPTTDRASAMKLRANVESLPKLTTSYDGLFSSFLIGHSNAQRTLVGTGIGSISSPRPSTTRRRIMQCWFGSDQNGAGRLALAPDQENARPI